jgi:hypothetical protein
MTAIGQGWSERLTVRFAVAYSAPIRRRRYSVAAATPQRDLA